jgi:predicted RND superfamily exporter protein
MARSLGLRWRRAALVLAALSALPAAVRMARLYQHLRPELDELLPEGSAAVRGARTLRARMAGAQHLGIVVRGSAAGAAPAFAATLARRLSAFAAERPDLVRSVRANVAAERAFLRRRGPLYLPLEDLRTIGDRLEARVRYEKRKANPLFVEVGDGGAPPPLDFHDIEARAAAADPLGGQRFPGDRLVSADGRLAVVLVFLATTEAGAAELAPIVARVRAEVAALAPATQGLEVGYAGDAAIAVEELSALESDVLVSALLVLVAVVLAILLYFRWWRALPVLALPLAVGTVWGFGLASLIVSSLGSSTAFLGSIVVGNGVNPGIMLLARHLEERRRGVPAEAAVAAAVLGTWRGTLAAAVAAAAGYASLLSTSFRGFSEFGVVAGAGALTCWLATYLLLPPLLLRLDRGAGAVKAVPTTAPDRGLLARTLARHGRPVLGASLILVAGAALLLPWLDRTRIEYDMRKLRNRDSLVRGEGYWSREMDGVLGRNFTAVVFMTESEGAAQRVAVALAEAVKAEPLRRVSSRVVTPADLLPPDQDARRAELVRIRRLLTPAVRASLDDGDRDQLEALVGAAEDGPLTSDELPELLVQGLRERDGRFGQAVLMLQSLDGSTWDGAVTIRAAAALERVAGVVSPSAAVAGGFVVSANILETLSREALPTTATAFGAVVLVVLALFRFRRDAWLVLAALLAGGILLAGAVVALGLRINFLNFIAFPITFGIGAEYALNVQSRHRQQPGGVTAWVGGTGGAVALCSLTTIIGYGSLLLARNQAILSFGLLAVLGEIACLLVAVAALPAALQALDRRAAT